MLGCIHTPSGSRTVTILASYHYSSCIHPSNFYFIFCNKCLHDHLHQRVCSYFERSTVLCLSNMTLFSTQRSSAQICFCESNVWTNKSSTNRDGIYDHSHCMVSRLVSGTGTIVSCLRLTIVIRSVRICKSVKHDTYHFNLPVAYDRLVPLKIYPLTRPTTVSEP